MNKINIVKYFWLMLIIILSFLTYKVTYYILDYNLMNNIYPHNADSIGIPIAKTIFLLSLMTPYLVISSLISNFMVVNEKKTMVLKTILISFLFFIPLIITYGQVSYWMDGKTLNHLAISFMWMCYLCWILITLWISLNKFILNKRIRLYIKYFIKLMMSLIIISLLLVFLWAIIFTTYYTAFLALILIAPIVPLKIYSRMIRLLLSLSIMIILLSTITFSVEEVNNRLHELAKIPRSTKSLNLFSTRDRLGIYGINIMMGALTYPIYPEIAKETLMMMVPTKNGIRVFNSDFALDSKKVQRMIDNIGKKLTHSKNKKEVFKKRISWNINNYVLGSKEARYALTLNPSDVTVIATKKKEIWLLDIKMKVKVIYPQHSNILLISYPKLEIEEGLIWVLQQVKWLHPYTAEWHFKAKIKR